MDKFNKNTKPQMPRINMRWPLIWIIILLALLYVMWEFNSRESIVKPDIGELVEDIEADRIRKDGDYAPDFDEEYLTGYYKKGDDNEEEKSGKQFDPMVVKAFLETIK